MERVQVTLPKAAELSRTFLSVRLQFPFSRLTSVHVHVYIYVYVHMDVNKPSTRCLCVQYTLFMVANVYIPTKLLFSLSLFSLSGLASVTPFKG